MADVEKAGSGNSADIEERIGAGQRDNQLILTRQPLDMHQPEARSIPSSPDAPMSNQHASSTADVSRAALQGGAKRYTDEMILPLPKYDDWYDALKSDDEEEYEKNMAQFSTHERKQFASGIFSYPNNLWGKETKCGYKACFILAAVFGSTGCASRMLADGADPLVRDPTNSDNWVHAAIEAAALSRENEPKLVELYKTFVSKLPRHTRRTLLEMENISGFRALELASKRGVYRLLRAIFDTKGVYVEQTGRRGLNVYLKYSLKEYRVTGYRERYMRSPLRLVSWAKYDELESLQESGFLKMPVVEQWMKRKFRAALLWIVIWTIVRIALLFFLFYFDPTQGGDPNATTPPPIGNETRPHHRSDGIDQSTYNTILVTLGTVGGVIALSDIVGAFVQLCDPLRRRIHGMDILCLADYVSKTSFYRINQFMLSVFTLIGFTLSGAAFRSDHALYLKCLILPVTIFSAMYLLEVIPYIGFFGIAMQQMTVIMFKFVVLVTCLNMLFAAFFHDVTYTNPNSMFKDMSSSHYSIFLLMQSEFNFGPNPPAPLQMAHIFFYYMSVVLLINYLIAVLSEAVTILTSAKDEMVFLRRLDVVTTVEDRVHWWLYRLFGAFKFCAEKDEMMIVSVTDASGIV
jgi:hypothetical protein